MNLVSAEVLQYIAWFLTLVEFILALYILFLNIWHTANRHVSALLLLITANTFALGLMLGQADTTGIARLISVATTPAVEPALFLVAVVLIKPQWLRGRWRWFWWLVYGLCFLPLILTVIDVAFGTGLWYGGFSPGESAPTGGFVVASQIATGTLAPFLIVLEMYILGSVPAIFLLYVILWDKEITPLTRRLAWLLEGAQIVALVFQFALRSLISSEVAALVSGFVFVLAYAYAGFQQMISERRLQRGRLQPRLTALVLAASVPIFVAAIAFLSVRVGTVLERKVDDQLAMTNRALAANASLWLNLNAQSLQELVSLPDIVSMDPARQKPLLEGMAAAHPDMYLVSTTDLSGTNVARNDAEAPKDYSDRAWFQEARDGAPLTLETLIGRTSGQPALVASTPIKDPGGQIVGVGMFAINLTDIAGEVQASTVGESGFAYVVDAQNRVVAHPDPAYSAELRDLSAYPPVAALRQGESGTLSFTDEAGQEWRASVSEMGKGWGVVVQQPKAEARREVQAIWVISAVVGAMGIAMLLPLASLTIRQAFLPIGPLTDTATAIAAGDLGREAPVESEDEIGSLARAFNSMTDQLRNLIGSLEQQVADRTRDLEQRSAYLEATAEVGRAAASILDPGQLIQQVVDLIRERFGLYYVGLFQVDETGEWAVLRAGTGEAGQAMLARGHRIKVGAGMIGWSVAHAQPRVALEAGADAVRLATPELPETHSEAALPLRSRGQVLGALTVQHTEPEAFDPGTMAVLLTMADQVAVALDNAHLFTEGQAALVAARRAYGEVSRQAWVELLRSRPDWGYRYAGHDVTPVDGDWIPEMSEAQQTGQAVLRNDARGTQEATLAIPLKVRDETVGVLGFRKGTPDETWTAEETEILQSFAAQVELALDSARLYQDAQRAAVEERLTSQITGRMRETLDVDMVLQTAIREMGTVLGIPKVEVRMGKGAPLQGISETSAAGNERAPRWGAEKGKEYGSLD